MEFANASFDGDTVQKKLILNLCNFLKNLHLFFWTLFPLFEIVTGINVKFFLYWSFTIIIQCSIDLLKWFSMVRTNCLLILCILILCIKLDSSNLRLKICGICFVYIFVITIVHLFNLQIIFSKLNIKFKFPRLYSYSSYSILTHMQVYEYTVHVSVKY